MLEEEMLEEVVIQEEVVILEEEMQDKSALAAARLDALRYRADDDYLARAAGEAAEQEGDTNEALRHWEHALRAGGDGVARDAPQCLWRSRGRHRLEDPGAAVVALQLALAAGDRHRRPRALAATAELRG